MIERTRAAELPEFCGEDEALHRIAVRPPTAPKFSHVAARLVAIRGQVGSAEKTGNAEQERLDVVNFVTERCEWKTLREQSKSELVLFIAERRRHFLKERRVASVGLDDILYPGSFALQPELRSCGEDVFEPVGREIVQRGL